ncbi:ABC transporter permease subunit/CPBP intramembrane protease [Thioflexithrix psekupsensis]|uniref:CPBP family intramembrane metalloprotease domain-containing protein n=1 Tax=Thioflexithrix psekupsensis TaxID=1570016 RepID=A0A251XBV3_9GAMM|nr:ABC transporter permease subunit/CPBP intramembrane protease [Thioflexithrix psekupsensis]OUD16207.1 hypothetical protein TPSD3_00320 [Thioflexithrix psekupsensis]
MNWPRRSIILTIFYTEILKVMRDRVTLFFSLILPLILWPLLALLMTQTIINHFLRVESEVSKIAIISDLQKLPDSLLHELENNDKLTLLDASHPLTKELNIENRQGIEQMINDHEFNALLLINPIDIIEHEKIINYHVSILFDSTQTASNKAANRLREILNEWKNKVVTDRLIQQGLAQSYIEPLTVVRENLATSQKQSRSHLGGLLPYVLVIMLLVGSFHPAIEVTAGEKEHGTLPTLLSTPVYDVELVLGKYFAIVLIAIASVTANIIGIASVLFFGLGQTDLNLSFSLLAVIFLILLPLAFLFSAATMSVAVFANSYREGQNLLAPLMIVGMLPALTSLIPDLELTFTLALLPGFNVAILIKQLLIQPIDPLLIFLTVFSNAVFALFALILITKIFASEPVIFAGQSLLHRLLSFRPYENRFPTANTGFFIYLILLILTFYASLGLARFGLHVQVPVMQLGLFLGLPLLLAWYFRWPIRQIFSLKKPTFILIIAAIFIGSTAWLALSWVLQLTPPPPEFTQKMLDLLSLTDNQYSLFVHLLLIALLPGLCEEFAFRGLLLSSFLRRFSPLWAIVLTAICFGLAHMSLYRFIPTALLGLLLGYVVWKTGSIWLAVIIHTLNNASTLLITRYLSDSETGQIVTDIEISGLWVLLAMILCALGLWLISVFSQANISPFLKREGS